MEYYKKVLMPIEVTVGDYCRGNERICGHFSNEGGHPVCDLRFYSLEEDKEGRVLKPEKCKILKNFN